MNKLMSPLLWISRQWWAFLLVLALNFASFNILFALEDRFEQISGVPTFDTQNDLTGSLLREQLPRYEGAALGAYYQFAAFDFVFPFVATLFLAVMWTLLLRINRLPIAARLLAWNIPLIAFLGTLFDYGENLFLLLVLSSADQPVPFVIQGALIAKQLKLFTLTTSGIITVALLILVVIDLLRRGAIYLRARSKQALPR